MGSKHSMRLRCGKANKCKVQNAKLKLTNPGVRFGWWYQNACGSKCRGDAHRGKKILPRTIDRGSAVTTSIYTETFSKKVWGCGGLSLKVPHEKPRPPKKSSPTKIYNVFKNAPRRLAIFSEPVLLGCRPSGAYISRWTESWG